uniref:Uncharacterized protein n=1 Tax=Siphoviridae sp. ctAUQ2 TaxID=2826182 RepID=A0A8S5MZ66_9CAUD|nr:MAG TPA: hypothetical protein [Siphoviridae sp. ctAUQ2]
MDYLLKFYLLSKFRFIREIMRRLSLLKDYVVLFQIELSYKKRNCF